MRVIINKLLGCFGYQITRLQQPSNDMVVFPKGKEVMFKKFRDAEIANIQAKI